ncbi:MAG: hypothetical protein ACPG8W_24840 [Candidatus Promineifilaceae bacterium]
MHSAKLRGTDFQIERNQSKQSHADFFANIDKHDRLGLVAPNRVDGVGAATLIMAFVTAFYDAYRAEGDAFFAYPAYFSFQPAPPVAHYSMFDIWPIHKNVVTGTSPVDKLNAINDRGVNILILPDTPPKTQVYERPQLESARRNIQACYLYAFEGAVADADIVIECEPTPLTSWAMEIFDTPTLAENNTVQHMRSQWHAMQQTRTTLRQTFRQISLDEALKRL